ncbi:MAG TPA: MYG1 family protein [Clostridia bacterium]|nr:MYG1 family protein [Clostridia bacterium]
MRRSDTISIKKEFKRVGTHDGRFHADEVMATAILKELYDLEVVRTRDMGILGSLDIVYDVGDGEYDHHNIEKKYRENGTPYAACGLIWRRFGTEVIHSKCQELSLEESVTIFQHIDLGIIQGIDAIDNGVRTVINIIPTMNISTIISGFNPPWDVSISENNQYFSEAVKIGSSVLDNALNEQIAVMKAKAQIIEAYGKRIRQEVLVLDKPYPWTSILNEIDIRKEILFVIFPRDGEFLIQTVRGSGGSYRNRKSLPKSWAGKREHELNEVIGIQDAIFCHPARFIAGAKSFESILKMADIAIREPVAAVKRGFLHNLRRLTFRERP